jgi:hypothetical protein
MRIPLPGSTGSRGSLRMSDEKKEEVICLLERG